MAAPLPAWLPQEQSFLLSLSLLTLLLSVYAAVSWKLIMALCRRDIVQLDLSKYRNANIKFRRVRIAFRMALFFLKYYLLFPLYSSLAFILLALALLLPSKTTTYDQVFLISSSVIAATRLLAYYDEKVSHEVIKLMPLTFLAILLLNPQVILDFSLSIDWNAIAASPLPFICIAFIIGLEWLLRIIYLAYRLARPAKPKPEASR